jgi:predicted 2-oxoglutarate/Fe(II)-dependent dioxygenase YbiX
MASRNNPCTCGSGLRFKHCCGSLTASSAESEHKRWSREDIYDKNGWFADAARENVLLQRFAKYTRFRATGAKALELPPGIIAMHNFVSNEMCAEWCNYIQAQAGNSLGVQDIHHHKETGEKRTVFNAARLTETVDLGPLKNEVLREIIRAYRDVIVPHFQLPLDTIEPPMALCYGPGGRYDCHADSEYWDRKNFVWTRSMNRDLSVLLYLSEDFEGGALFFPNFNLRIYPTAGMMVAFPSDHRYIHAAEPLISGSRTAIVSWAAAKTPKLFDPMSELELSSLKH